MFRCICLFLFICSVCCGEDLLIKFDNDIYRVGNTHLFGEKHHSENSGKLFVSSERDIYLEQIGKNKIGDHKITDVSDLKFSSEIIIDGDRSRICGFDQHYIYIEKNVMYGDSGKIVYNDRNEPAALVTGFRLTENGRKNIAVRLDNIKRTEFVQIAPEVLYNEWKIFRTVKEREYFFVEELKKCASRTEAEKFLSFNTVPVRQYKNWKSVFLQRAVEESEQKVNMIYKRFAK